MERSTEYQKLASNMQLSMDYGEKYKIAYNEMDLCIVALEYYARYLKEQKQKGN